MTDEAENESHLKAPGDGYLLLSAAQAASLCGVGRSTWWRLHASGRVPSPVKLGSSTRWKAAEIRAWVDAGCPSRDRWEAMQVA